jgi:signal peptidase
MEIPDYSLKPSKQSWRSFILGLSISAFCLLVIFGVFQASRIALDTDVPYVVAEGISMYPNINNGDIVVIRGIEAEDVKVGDVIIFNVPQELKEELPPRVTHRVIDIKSTQVGLVFRTKGDNAPMDSWEVHEERVLGRMVMRIPYVGMFILLAKTPFGVVVLVGIFLLLSYVGRKPRNEAEI